MADGTILIYENSTFSSRNIAHSVKHQEREREIGVRNDGGFVRYSKRDGTQTRQERRSVEEMTWGRKAEKEKAGERGRKWSSVEEGVGTVTMMDGSTEILCPFAFWAAAMNSRDNHGRSPPSVYGSLFQLLQLNLGRKRAESNIFSRGRNYNGMEMFRRNF